MEKLKLVPGDFLKNAGIVGFLRLMDFAGIHPEPGTDDTFDVQKILELDLAQLVIDAFIEEYGEDTKVFQALKDLERLAESPQNVEKYDAKKWKDEILTPLTSSSLISGFDGIKNQIEDGEIYELFHKEKLKFSTDPSEMPGFLQELKRLHAFCQQELVRKTFLFKNIIYNIIDRFWDGVAFLNISNSKKPLLDSIREKFEQPFKTFLLKEKYGSKDICIDCGLGIGSKEKVAITMMKDVGDDLNRKTSAFWNCKADAYLCPVCAFLYSLVPLGFVKMGNGDFLFVNVNTDVSSLAANNRKKISIENARPTWREAVDHTIEEVLDKKKRILGNIQVIVRSSLELKYHFQIIDKEVVRLLQSRTVKKALDVFRNKKEQSENENKTYVIKMSKDTYLNPYQEVIENILNYRNQYNLLNTLLFLSLKQPWVQIFLKPILDIQIAQFSQKETLDMDLSKLQYFATKSGDELRFRLIADKLGSEDLKSVSNEKKEDAIRGIVYQLANAMKVGNRERFMDIVIRLYTSCQKPIPTVFQQALQSEELFNIIGYAFVIGLKGGSYQKKEGEESHD